MSDIEIKRTPELIGAEIRTITQQARYMVLLYGMEIGRRLTEAKQLLEHGEWLPWLERETEFSPATASRYVKLYDEYGADQSSLFGTETNFATLKNLSVSNALRLIAIPAEEREEFAETNNVESLSARELDELIKTRTAELEKQTRDAQEALLQAEEGQALALAEKEAVVDKLSEQLSKARERIRELGEAPVPVAVERDEDAIKAAAEAARAEVEQELKKERDHAAKIFAEKEQLIRRLAEAQASSGSVAAFKVVFETVQQDFARLVEQYRQVQGESAETAEKLSKAISALLDKLSADMEIADAN